MLSRFSSIYASLKVILLISFPALFSLLVACGGGGGGSSSTAETSPQSQPSATDVPAPVNLTSNTQPDGLWTRDREYLGNKGLDLIHADVAYEQGASGAGQFLGFVDSGIATTHNEFKTADILKPKITFNNVASNVISVRDTDLDHGTSVASIAAGNRGTGSTMHGVAYNAQIAMWGLDKNSSGLVITSAILDRAYMALNNSGAKVISNSWGIGFVYRPEGGGGQDLIAAQYFGSARSRMASGDSIYVFSAGNTGADNVVLSAALPLFFHELRGKFVAVTAIDLVGEIGLKANRCGAAASFCMAAPGVGDYANGYLEAANAAGRYRVVSGTSFASAYVSGALVLMRQVFGDQLSAQQYVARLFARANKSGRYADTAIYGQGLLDVAAAITPAGLLSVPIYGGSSVALGQSRDYDTSFSLYSLVANSNMGSDLIALDALGDPFKIGLKGVLEQNTRVALSADLMSGYLNTTENHDSPNAMFWSTHSAHETVYLEKQLSDVTFKMRTSMADQPRNQNVNNQTMSAMVSFVEIEPVSPHLPSLNMGVSLQKDGLLNYVGTGAVSTRGLGRSIYFGLQHRARLADNLYLSVNAQWATGELSAQGGLIEELNIRRSSSYAVQLTGANTSFVLKQMPRVERGVIRMRLPTRRNQDGRVDFSNTAYEISQAAEFMFGMSHRLSPDSTFFINTKTQNRVLTVGIRRVF